MIAHAATRNRNKSKQSRHARIKQAAAVFPSPKDPEDSEHREDRLHEIEQELKRRCRIERYNALEIGALYCEAKRLLLHGQFAAWIDETRKYTGYGRSAAHNYMRIYQYCCGRPELVEAIKPTMLQIICEPRFPADLREEIFNREGFDGKVSELADVAKRVRTKEIKVTDKPVQDRLRDMDDEKVERLKNDILRQLKTHISNAGRELRKLLPKSIQVIEYTTGQYGEVQTAIEWCSKREVKLEDNILRPLSTSTCQHPLPTHHLKIHQPIKPVNKRVRIAAATEPQGKRVSLSPIMPLTLRNLFFTSGLRHASPLSTVCA